MIHSVKNGSPIVVERVTANDMHAEQHRIISPAADDTPAARALLDAAPRGHAFTAGGRAAAHGDTRRRLVPRQ